MRGPKLVDVLVIVGMVGLSACVSRTPYQPLKSDGGYSERRIDKDTQVARFAGNAETHPGDAALYSQVRAVELCQEQGFRYAHIIDVKNLSVTHEAHEGQSKAEVLPIFETYFNCTNLEASAAKSAGVDEDPCQKNDRDSRGVCKAAQPRQPAALK